MEITEKVSEGQAGISAVLRSRMNPLQTSVDLDSMIEQIGDARIVMLGEASHGTHEYHTWRARISQRLIEEKGFDFIAVEGDWPDCYRLNRYVKNYQGAGVSAFEILHAFNRWPTWMWGNWETVAFAEWLSDHNRALSVNRKAGFYGLDVYSLHESLEAIIGYLKRVDPDALAVAEKAFRCFAPYEREEGTLYAYASLMVPDRCTNEVVGLLSEMRRKAPQYNSDHENGFSAEQNAFVSVNAERYYRAMLTGGATTWNIRDNHMMQTLQRLLNFHGSESKAIVWAHNTHIGDARATDMRFEGMHNLGELARKHYGNESVFLIGFGSYEGTVMAARRWGKKPQHLRLPPASKDSWEYLLNETGVQSGYLYTRDLRGAGLIDQEIRHRAVGVVYNPSSDQFRNYAATCIPYRYDAFVFFHQTKALLPLHILADSRQMPETYPFAY